ncbi:MAG: succinate dehydrogenase/fumarate reductase iron-sulfur subunit [Deltaproteobacteria bacterium]|nr:succinate dehydrogenase/fumarate reductase iron-sulfur subunit [Deltaproteobacteria bacterium]
MAIINLKLKVWRQKSCDEPGKFQDYASGPVTNDMSFLEMLDVLNERLTMDGEEPIAFDHDCREGICGMCGAMVNGYAHGRQKSTTLCQLHLRHFKDGETIVIEPFRAKVFKPIKDLIVDRSAFDHIITAGGYISINVGGAPDANAVAIPQDTAELALDAASCIGCGACVASCPNAAAMLFTGARVSQFALLPQGNPERSRRVKSMLAKMGELGFGNCGNERECEASCPKNISIRNIARLNREFIRAAF